MTKYEYVVVSCTDRDIALVGKFDNEKDAFKAMIYDFVEFHNEMDALKELYEAVKQTELPDKEYTVDEVVNEILDLTGNGCGRMEEQPDSMSIYSFLITGQECWSNLNKRDAEYDCKIIAVEKEYKKTADVPAKVLQMPTDVDKKLFKVHISEVIGRTVIINAEDKYEAVEAAEELCNDGVINLDGNDFASRTVDVLGEIDKKDAMTYEFYKKVD